MANSSSFSASFSSVSYFFGIALLLFSLTFFGCKSDTGGAVSGGTNSGSGSGTSSNGKGDATGSSSGGSSSSAASQPTLVFNSDSAMAYVKAQVDFGFRVPGTAAHEACGDWLVSKLSSSTDKLTEQKAEVTVWDGKKVPMRNIIGSFRPEATARILLAAHWDTRPYADQDTVRKNEPIVGANDGASGVGVLIEIARALSSDPTALPAGWGLDIVFFDVEDYGWSGTRDSYCLGSQYWSRQPHVAGYRADYGILLDMVGAKGAYFYREGISMRFASHIVKRIWDEAARAGYRDYFWFNEAPYPELTDDHLYVNTIAGIPMIDIIQYDELTAKGFFQHWHTHGDDLSVIDPATLKAVGQTVLNVVQQ